MCHLARMVRDVSDQQDLLAFRSDMDAEVAGRMTGCRDQAELVANQMVSPDKVDEPSGGDRPYRVVEDCRARRALICTPIIKFHPAHQVTRAGKRRHPASIDQHRVPADVIDMQMSTKNSIDRLDRAPGGSDLLEKW